MAIKAKIDVTKIDSSALFAGAKGKYLDVVLWETPNDQYGNDYKVVQDLPKERRDAGEKGAILGNAKNFGKKPFAAAPPARKPAAKPDAFTAEDESPIPF